MGRARRSRVARAVHLACGLAALAMLVGGVQATVGWGATVTTIVEAHPVATVAVLVAAAGAVAARWFAQTAAIDGLSIRQAGVVDLAAVAAADTLPGGGAIGTAMRIVAYRDWGISGQTIASGMVVGGVIGTAVPAMLSAGALAWAVTTGIDVGAIGAGVTSGLLIALVAAAAALLAFSNAHLARRAGTACERIWGRLRQRPGDGAWGEAFEEASRRTWPLFAAKGRAIIVAVLVSQALSFATFALALVMAGIAIADLTVSGLFAAWAIGRVAGAVPVTPGGAGVTELALAFGLSIFTGVSGDAAMTAVIAYRFVTWLLPVIAGGFCALALAKGRRGESDQSSVEGRAPHATP